MHNNIINVSGKTIVIKVNDLGSLYSRSGVITSDVEIDQQTATSEEKIYAAYVTEENGTIENKEDTHNTNLIF